jgi:hypothetical protein
MMYPQTWNGVEHFGTLDVEALTGWANTTHWTEDERAMKAQLDGERRQADQIADSTGRLVARLMAAQLTLEEQQHLAA